MPDGRQVRSCEHSVSIPPPEKRKGPRRSLSVVGSIPKSGSGLHGVQQGAWPGEVLGVLTGTRPGASTTFGVVSTHDRSQLRATFGGSHR